MAKPGQGKVLDVWGEDFGVNYNSLKRSNYVKLCYWGKNRLTFLFVRLIASF